MDSSRIAEWLRSFVPTRRRLVVGILVALALTPALLFVQRSLHASAFLLEEQLHDWHQKFTVLRPPDSHPLVALIVVDDELVGRSQGAAEVDRVVLARIVRTVDALGARVLGIDMTFLTPSTAAADEALVNALRQARSATVMGFADERSRVDGQEAEFQSTLLARVARPVGFTHIRVDRDGVVRYWASPADNASVPLSFPAQLMRAVGTERREPPYPRIDWLGNTLDGGAPFAVIPASHLREALGQDVRRLSAAVKDRIVLIGLSTKETRRIRTPLTGADRILLTSAEVHAHVLAQLLDGRAFSQPSMLQLVGWYFSRILFGFFVGCRRRHVRSDTMAALGGAGGLFWFDAYTFGAARTVVPVTMLAIGWIAGVAAGHLVWRLGGGGR